MQPSEEELGDLSLACERLWHMDSNRAEPGCDYQLNLQVVPALSTQMLSRGVLLHLQLFCFALLALCYCSRSFVCKESLLPCCLPVSAITSMPCRVLPNTRGAHPLACTGC